MTISKTSFIPNLLKNDDSALQFSELYSVVNVYSDVQKAVNEFSNLLLPLTLKKEIQIIKHSESYIIKKFKTRLFSQHKELEEKVTKNYLVKTEYSDKSEPPFRQSEPFVKTW